MNTSDIFIDVSVDEGKVFCALISDEPVNYLSMSPVQAKLLAQHLIEVADLISPKEPVTLFKALQKSINELMSLRNRD